MIEDADDRLLLVGDNPFLSISHLSQHKARERSEDPSNPVFAARLLQLALENGANGFTFSVCDSNLAILGNLDIGRLPAVIGLFPVVPYAFEYVQKATQRGGISGLVKTLGWEMVRSGNTTSLVYGALTSLTANPKSLLKAYISYELSRLETHENEKVKLQSVFLHQLVTDLALALDLDWLFKEYVALLLQKKITPGFNTGNFAYLVQKFGQWKIDLSKILILAPFNKVGFQMIPSLEKCEEAIGEIPIPNVIALSVLAAGYLRPREAFDYIASLHNIKGVAVGISKEKQAVETFRLLRESLESPTLEELNENISCRCTSRRH